MPKDSIVEIPPESGNKYRYVYEDGQTVYKGPVGDSAPISEAEFHLLSSKWMSDNYTEDDVRALGNRMIKRYDDLHKDIYLRGEHVTPNWIQGNRQGWRRISSVWDDKGKKILGKNPTYDDRKEFQKYIWEKRTESVERAIAVLHNEIRLDDPRWEDHHVLLGRFNAYATFYQYITRPNLWELESGKQSIPYPWD